jgi:hypothetical protein
MSKCISIIVGLNNLGENAIEKSVAELLESI